VGHPWHLLSILIQALFTNVLSISYRCTVICHSEHCNGSEGGNAFLSSSFLVLAFKINSNIILTSTFRSTKWCLSFSVSYSNSARFLVSPIYNKSQDTSISLTENLCGFPQFPSCKCLHITSYQATTASFHVLSPNSINRLGFVVET
jgi:hypothetical protein